VPTINLTQLAAERLRPPSGGVAVTYFDTNLAGFGLRVSPRGRKTWIAQYRVRDRVRGSKEILETLGTMQLIPNVKDARDRARVSINKAREGINPVQERQQQAAEDAANAFTFAKLAERYMTEYAYRNTKQSTARQTERLLRKASVFFGDKPVRNIRKVDVIALTSVRKPNHTATSGLIEANNLLGAVRRACKWAKKMDIIEVDPTIDVPKPLAKEPSRDRVLTDDEIVSFWNGCDQLGWPFGPLFQLLLLTAQRRGEVAGMRWSELDLQGKLWHLPGTRTKNSRPHDVHLSDFALEIIEGLVQFKPEAGKPDFVFSFTGDSAVSGFAFAKANLAEIMDVQGWQMHDLRRTATTGMARLGILPHVIDKILNHTVGALSGISLIYNRFQYLQQRKDALELWGRFVQGLVRPETAH
jgi:integrase